MNMIDWLQRSELLIKPEGIEKLKKLTFWSLVLVG